MRLAGTITAIVGLVVLIVGLFSGVGGLFSWNGRHAVESRSFAPGTPLAETLTPEPGRRYSVGVQVVFDREGLPEREGGDVSVEAKMPLVAKIKDRGGATLGETTGWLDPEQAPTIVFGTHPVPEHRRGPAAKNELVAERVVGAFSASSREPVEVRVDLGTDRVGTARVVEARMVVYDDALPPPIMRSLGAAGAGALAFVVGFVLVVMGWFRRRARRGGIRRRQIV